MKYSQLEFQKTLKQRTACLEKLNNNLMLELENNKINQSKIVHEHEKFKSVLQHIKNPIIIINDLGCIDYWNSAAEFAFAYSAEEISGKCVFKNLVPEKYRNALRRGLPEFRCCGKSKIIGITREFNLLNKYKEEIPVEISLSSFKIGNHWYAVAIILKIKDISVSSQKRLENMRLSAIQNFARSIAHEFRQPLTALKLMADLVECKGVSDEFLKNNSKRILKQVARIDELVEKLNNASNYENIPYAAGLEMLDLS